MMKMCIRDRGFNERPRLLEEKQAFAAVGQARLMMVYQKLFAEYNQTAAQILMTKNTVTNPQSRFNAHNTFNELLKLGTIPIVNENDTVATDEIQFGDNDRLSAIVAALVEADILILMSDIDGLYTCLLYTSALRRFKRNCAKAGIQQEIRKREHYEKPSVRRKKKSEAARKRKYN